MGGCLQRDRMSIQNEYLDESTVKGQSDQTCVCVCVCVCVRAVVRAHVYVCVWGGGG